MSYGPIVRALESARDFLDYANPSEVQDLVADGGGPSRRIRPLADGSLVVKNKAGVSRTLAVTENVDEDIQAITIEAATDIAVRVYW